MTEARIAYGGMAATPARALKTEAALLGQPWCEASVLAALPCLDRDYTPMSDHRGSDWYRAKVARNLLLAFYEETRSAPYVHLPDRPTATVVLEDAR